MDTLLLRKHQFIHHLFPEPVTLSIFSALVLKLAFWYGLNICMT